MSFWIHPEAEAELGDAAMYYAEQASVTVALAFLAEFERVRDILVENPARGPQVYAVAHQHRQPGYWLSRT